MDLTTSLATLEQEEFKKANENQLFREYLKGFDSKQLDEMVHTIHEEVASQIDCTLCGNCCKTLMVNITQPECENISTHLQLPIETFKNKYIETSQQGMMIMNEMPCAFLKDKKCSVYEHRFTECREFPHLHKPGFQLRLFGTLMHYGRCPIIYNVIEQLKERINFKNKKK